MKNYNIDGHYYEDSESFGVRRSYPRQFVNTLRPSKTVWESTTEWAMKNSLKNHAIKNVVRRLAVSAMAFFLIAPVAYSHPSGPRLDSNGGHFDERGEYHEHLTPKEVLQLIEETRRLEKEKREKENLINKKQTEMLKLLKKSDGQKQSSEKNQLDMLDQQIEELNQQIEELNQQMTPMSMQSSAMLNQQINRSNIFLPPSDDKERQKTEKKVKFLGAGFGLSVGLIHGLGPKNVEATLDENGIVNVTEDKTKTVNFFLETHYYPEAWRFGKGNLAHGPFVLMNAGAIDTDADTLTTFGIGWMLGVRVKDKAINIGAAYALQKGVQSLRNNFVAGQEAPQDDEGNFIEPQYTKSTEGAWLLLVSFSPF